MAEDTLEHLTARIKKGLIYTLTVRTSHVEGVAALKAIAGVSSVTPAGPQLIIEIQSGAPEIRDQITQTAVQHGMGVLEFSAERVSLEEIFLQLTTIDPTHTAVGASA